MKSLLAKYNRIRTDCVKASAQLQKCQARKKVGPARLAGPRACVPAAGERAAGTPPSVQPLRPLQAAYRSHRLQGKHKEGGCRAELARLVAAQDTAAGSSGDCPAQQLPCWQISASPCFHGLCNA